MSTPIIRATVVPTVPIRRIRCGICHHFRDVQRFRKIYKTVRNQKVTKHFCPRERCPGLESCGYVNGHKKEIAAKKRKVREAKRKQRELKKQKAREEKEANRKQKADERRKEAEEKKAKMKRHLFGECKEIEVFMKKLGVEKR